jgi:hypothetical protein
VVWPVVPHPWLPCKPPRPFQTHRLRRRQTQKLRRRRRRPPQHHPQTPPRPARPHLQQTPPRPPQARPRPQLMPPRPRRHPPLLATRPRPHLHRPTPLHLLLALPQHLRRLRPPPHLHQLATTPCRLPRLTPRLRPSPRCAKEVWALCILEVWQALGGSLQQVWWCLGCWGLWGRGWV